MASRSGHAIMADTGTNIDVTIDNPCWGSLTLHSLHHLLSTLDKSTSILYESSDYIVLHKPPDLRMDGDFPATVHKLLWYWYRPPSLMLDIDDDNADTKFYERVATLPKLNTIPDNQLRPCHQLDYATSGVVLLARNKPAARIACEAFHDRAMQKQYLALVQGRLMIQGERLSITILQLTQQMRHMEQRMERNKAKKRQDTFRGYQPPHSLFLKWKAGLSRTHDINTLYRKRPRVKEPFNAADYVRQQLSPQEQESIPQLGWADIKSYHHVFQDLSDKYNDALRLQYQEQPDIERKEQELPTFFRLSDQDDNDESFYIFASLAQQPDSFAMKTKTTTKTKSIDNVDDDDGLDYKHSLTKCQILHYLDNETTKVVLIPFTGRRHQLRCHMLLCGTPIVGDATYGNREAVSPRMCLHSYSLELPGVLPKVVAPDPWINVSQSSKHTKY